MLEQHSSQPSHFIVDPNRDGIANALWKTISGTPAVNGSLPDIVFRFNTAHGLVRADCLHGQFDFSVKFPLAGANTVTNLVNDISFGLENVSLGNLCRIEFFADKSANKAYFRTYDEFGTVTSTEVTWAVAWNGVATVFRFGWSDNGVSLQVLANAGTAFTSLATHKVADYNIPNRALNPFVNVVGAENLDVDFISMRNVQHSSIMLI